MVKLLVLFSVLFSLSGCGRAPGLGFVGFEKEVNSFINEGKLRNRDYDPSWISITTVASIDAAQANTSVPAKCRPDGVVVVNLSWWNSNDATSRELVVFHELGHCLMKKGHIAGAGIMNAYEDAFGYSDNRTQYLDAFFAR